MKTKQSDARGSAQGPIWMAVLVTHRLRPVSLEAMVQEGGGDWIQSESLRMSS